MLSGMRTLLAMALGFALLFTASAQAERRVALVIGNSTYKTVSPLRNPVNDVRLMRRALKAAGFDVMLVENADYQRMRKAIIDFGNKLSVDTVGLFYYSGHGIQFDGANFMVPVDAKLAKKDYVAVEAVNLNDVLARMGAAENRLNIVVLDACRNNPFPAFEKAASRGLAVTPAPGGTYIAYATAPDDVATDGTGRNSPFTAALAQTLGTVGLELDSVFKTVRDKVYTVTAKRQLPWSSSSVRGDFYFHRPMQTGGRPDPNRQAAATWAVIKDSQDIKVLENFILAHRESSQAATARERLRKLKGSSTKIAAATPPAKPPGAAKPKPAVGLRFAPGDTFKDCAECPEMVVIPSGSFMMGSPFSEPQRNNNEGPQHRVNIGYQLAVGKFEVTQAEWRHIMGKNPSWFKGDRNPVEKVNWDDAQAYLRKLSQMVGKRYRLLSEAEWEYVARAGTTSPFHTGNQITTSQANFNGKYTYNGSAKGRVRKATISVGSFRANRFGVHDMHGNVMEWVGDCWNPSYNGAPIDGSVPTHGICGLRLQRGGSWNSEPWYLRSAYRIGYGRTLRDLRVGFRVARTLTS